MIKKQFLKTKCKVTFEAPKDIVADSVALVGEFNDWDIAAMPMKRLKSGVWKATVDLKKDDTYQFRYLIDGKEWVNDGSADCYIANNVDGDNSVVITSSPA
jgi:1,4-alpha-glucan branching enzyme